MDMIQIVLISLIATLLFIVLKDLQPTFAFFILIVTSVFIFLIVTKQINIILQFITSLGEKASINHLYLTTILKIIGIAYITELSANLTKDAGLTSIASKIELAGKIFILLLAIPIITAVIETILHFVPNANLNI